MGRSVGRWIGGIPGFRSGIHWILPDWTSSVMGSHEAVRKLQTCHNPKAGILGMASALEVEGTWKAGRHQTNHTQHLRGKETERA